MLHNMFTKFFIILNLFWEINLFTLVNGCDFLGSVNLTLVTMDSSTFMAEWRYPVWDTEKLISSYNITCSNGTTAVSTIVLNDTDSRSTGTITQLLTGLNTDKGYECCVKVRTLNGDGPPSCTEGITTITTTMTTTSITPEGPATIAPAGPAGKLIQCRTNMRCSWAHCPLQEQTMKSCP